MSFEVGQDGEVTFKCQGCAKTAKTRSLKNLPRGWTVTGILCVAYDPESDAPEEPTEDWAEHQRRLQARRSDQDRRMASLGELVGAHFCGKCAKKVKKDERIAEKVKEAKVTLALYGKCEVIVDGAGAGRPPRGDDREPEPTPGSPPPFEVGGGAPI